MIKAESLQKSYQTGEIITHALHDITLTIREGEFVAIMGPSGCGKSTLLHILGLLDTPTRGHLQVFGREVAKETEKIRFQLRKGKIGFVFQNSNLISELTVYENIELPLVYLNIPSRVRSNKVKGMVEKMQLAHRQGYYPQQLSGGQQQRVALARALISEPQLILADEPTGNLDSMNGGLVMNLLKDLHRQGSTIVMVTHSVWCGEQAERIINLFDGCVVG